MSRRLNTGAPALALVTLVLALLVGAPAALLAQQGQPQGRMRILVPRLEPREDADDDFGEDVAEKVQDLINDLPTHAPVERGDFRQALRKYDLDEDELNCIKSRQLAGRIDAGLVMCGGYVEVPDGYEVDARFIVASSGEEFNIDPFAVTGDDLGEQAAEHIFQAFEKYVQQLQYTQYCGDYLTSQQWKNALTNCDKAIALNPQSVSARYNRARALMELERYEEALDELESVLELRPVHENALQSAGYAASQLDRTDEARSYYSEYLELQPGNAQVRMKIAYDLAREGGDPRGAMQLIEEGLEIDSTNVDLWQQYGNFALSAAQDVAVPPEEREDGLSPEARELYATALDAYEHVFEARGADAEASMLRNMVAAASEIGEFERATDIAQRAIEAHPDEPQLKSIHANALKKAGRLDEAISVLDSLQSEHPDFTENVVARQGAWLLEAGRIEDALPKLERAVELGEQSADAIARTILANAHQKGVQENDFGYAIPLLRRAREFAESDEQMQELNFWLGYSIYQQAVAEQKPQTLETANATLPRFQRALELFRNARAYAESQPSIEIAKFIEAAGKYIEIQQAIIKRGR